MAQALAEAQVTIIPGCRHLRIARLGATSLFANRNPLAPYVRAHDSLLGTRRGRRAVRAHHTDSVPRGISHYEFDFTVRRACRNCGEFRVSASDLWDFCNALGIF
jgi:hypothetical protein